MRIIKAKSIVQANNNFNLYRGCTHGCIYCDARSTCYQVGTFEDIAIKADALKLIDEELAKKRKKVVLTTGAMSDPYVHLEHKLQLTRGALTLIKKHGFGISVLTKSSMILRDLELYKAINQHHKAIVQLTITTTNDQLARVIEPKVTLPSKRFETLKTFADHGITTGIWMTPILPFITDNEENIRNIVIEAAIAKVSFIMNFGMGTTMREGSREHFYHHLDLNFPGLKDQYVKTYQNKYICPSPKDKMLQQVFETECEKHGILFKKKDIDALFSNNKVEQISLF